MCMNEPCSFAIYLQSLRIPFKKKCQMAYETLSKLNEEKTGKNVSNMKDNGKLLLQIIISKIKAIF